MISRLRRIVAKNIRSIRIKRALTQEQLASKCKMHDNYISKVELGKVSIGIDNLSRVAKALKIAPHLLLIPESYKSE
ncbi:MAG: helix-turn-helix domain-containing protein [Candidatus Kapaibacterium sp.]